MRLRNYYITTVLMILVLVAGCTATISRVRDLESRVAAAEVRIQEVEETAECILAEFISLEALQPALDDLARYQEKVDQYTTKVDDMVMSYGNLDEILKNMGEDAQRYYMRLIERGVEK